MAGKSILISILADGRKAVSELRRVEKATKGTGDQITGIGKKLAGAAIGAVGIGTLAAAFTDGVKEASAFQDVARQTDAALKNNTKLAGLTTKQVQAQSAALETLTGAKIDENAATDAQNRLIRAGVASQALLQQGLKASADVSLATGKDLAGVSTALGKALADPTKAAGVLGKAGVALSKSQQLAINQLVKTGDVAGAQSLVLRDLESKYKGASEAAGKGFSADVGRAKDALADSERNIVTAVLPSLSKLAQAFSQNLPTAIAAVTPVMNTLFTVASNPAFLTLAGIILTAVAAFKVYSAVVATVSAVTRAWAVVQAALNIVLALNPVTLIVLAIIALVAVIVLAYQHSEIFRRIVNGAFSAVLNVIRSVVAWVRANWPLLLAILLGPIAVAVLLISRNFGRIRSFISSVVEWVKANWPLLLTLLLGPIAVAVGLIVGHFATIKAAVIGTFNGIRDKMSHIGDDIVSGIADGLRRSAHLVTAQINKLIDLIPGPIKDALDIHSPSRLMAKLGGYTVEGFALGMTGTLGKVSTASRRVATTVVGTLGSSLGGVTSVSRAIGVAHASAGSSAGSGTHITVNVPPTADKASVGKAVLEALNAHQRAKGQPKIA